jgi:hypothetical protein
MLPVLEEQFPAAKIIVLHVSNFFTRPRAETAACISRRRKNAVWSPGSGIALQRFLENEIPDSEAASIRIIEWRPSLAAYGAEYLKILSETADFIKRIDANKRTLRGFGRRWFKNFFRNISLIKKILFYTPFSIPLAVTGAGPGLEETIPFIRRGKERGKLLVLAASSSAAALQGGGVIPDLVIATDGGGWALFHLYECFRGSKENYPGLAAGLTAALPSQCADLSILPISDGSLWQNLILRDLGIPFLNLPQRGTVSASALDLAFSLTSGKVFIGGMDLSVNDIRTHARPYSFDRFQEEKAGRLNPVYSQRYDRSRAIASGGSYGLYAAWFNRQLGSYPGRLYTLGKNNAVFKSLQAGDGEEKFLDPKDMVLPASSSGLQIFKEVPAPALGTANPPEILVKALGDPKKADLIRAELLPLLFHDGVNPSPEELGEEILTLAGPYYGAAHE